MIYLASPYTHPDPAVRDARYRSVSRKAADMLRNGIAVFSPIVYSHALAALGLPTTWPFWRALDRTMIAASSEVWVLMLPGWKESVGVQAEIQIAREMGKPFSFIKAWPSSDRTPAALLRAGAVGL